MDQRSQLAGSGKIETIALMQKQRGSETVRSVLDPTIPIDIGEPSQRQRIVDAMVESCAEKTYAATTIADIVSRASISRTTFYKRFDDKRDCFDAALDRCIERAAATAAAARTRDADPPPEAVRKAAAAMLELMAAKPGLAQLVIGEAIAVEPAIGRRYRELLIPAAGGLWDDGGEPRRAHTDPRLAFGRAQVLIFNQIAAGAAEQLPELLPELVYLALLPFAGHEEALEQARLAGDDVDAERLGEPVTERPSDLRQWRLPRGRHGLPRELVDRSQRERLLAAVVRVTAANGYESTTVADILEEAGVGRESFYELFDDKRDCMLAAHGDPRRRPRSQRARRLHGAGTLGRAGPRWAARRCSTGSPPTRRRRASCWSSWPRSGPPRASSSRRDFARFTKLLDDGLDEAEPGPDLPQATEPRGRRRAGPRLRGGRPRPHRRAAAACCPNSPTSCSSPSSAKRPRGTEQQPQPPRPSPPERPRRRRLSTATRSALGSGVRDRPTNSAMPLGSVTTVSVASPSISGRATPASTGVTRPIHSEESRGVSTGTVTAQRRPAAEGRGQFVDHAAVGGDVGAADLDLAVERQRRGRLPRRGRRRRRRSRSAGCGW